MPNNPTPNSSTTQQFLDIFDISNDLLMMKSGSVARVLSVNAINFGLFAEEEQDAVIYSYAGLLNSLNYPIQIVIRSQTKDVTNYLNLLKEQENKTTSELKKNQIARYRNFVSELIKERNVLDKKFYVVIPATALEMGLLAPATVLPGSKPFDLSTIEKSLIIEKAITILDPRRDHLIGQFGRIGLIAHQLDTQELIRLFYLSYNPEAAEGQQITDTKNYTTALVEAQYRNLVVPTNPTSPASSAGPAPTPTTTPAPTTPTTSPTNPLSAAPLSNTQAPEAASDKLPPIPNIT